MNIWLCIIVWLTVLGNVAFTQAAVDDSGRREQWAVHMQDPESGRNLSPKEAKAFAKKEGLEYKGQIGDLEGCYMFEAVVFSQSEGGPTLARRTVGDVNDILQQAHPIQRHELQIPKQRHKRELDFKKFPDPQFPRQWHLFNDGYNGVYQGHDINVMPVWARGINGSGVVVSVIDDGVDFLHPDLAANWYEAASYDFNLETTKPLPQTPEDTHGTRCAGEIAAAINDACGVGVAHGVHLSAERLISSSTTDAVEARALNYLKDVIDIYSSSWGPSDDGMALDGPGFFAQAALEEGVNKGRKGRGNIFVFASGNGGQEGDDCNFDSYANAVQTIAIGAINNMGTKPSYSELCSAHLAVTYSGGNGLYITTTDINNQCTNQHSGTSAAAPLASGMIALMLQARPELSWRDVQHLVVTTAKKNDPSDADWITNGAGLHVNHKYGFGSMDATLLVDAAQSHRLLPSPSIKLRKSSHKRIKLLPGSIERDSIEVNADDSPGLAYTEHVQVTVRIAHQQRKFIYVKLTSPSKTESVLAAPRFRDDAKDGFVDWTFMTVRAWGEKAYGTWTLSVEDVRLGDTDPYTGEPFTVGELESWILTVHGRCAEDDVVVDPNQLVSEGRTCSHSLASSRRRRATLVAAAGFVALSVTLGLMILFYRRYRRAGRIFVPLSTQSSSDDVESSPVRGFPPLKSPKSPAETSFGSILRSNFERGNNGSEPKTATASNLQRSLSIELLSIRNSRTIDNSALSPQVAVDIYDSSEDNLDRDVGDNLGRPAKDSPSKKSARLEDIRKEYWSKAGGSLARAQSTGSLHQLESLAGSQIPPRSQAKTPPPNLGAQSLSNLSRSSSTTSLMKRSASAELLKKYTD
ncbi:peptidase S8/S53 domain-containing protein [Phlyctochytrium arcticum]|nr:peptidase S8/S53 domain-containing protein [Phlyctochytrium arcticum]